MVDQLQLSDEKEEGVPTARRILTLPASSTAVRRSGGGQQRHPAGFVEVAGPAAQVRELPPLRQRQVPQRILTADDYDGTDPELVVRLENWRWAVMHTGHRGRTYGDVPGWVQQYVELRETHSNIGASSWRSLTPADGDAADGWIVERAVGELTNVQDRAILRGWHLYGMPASALRRWIGVRNSALLPMRLHAEKKLQKMLAK